MAYKQDTPLEDAVPGPQPAESESPASEDLVHDFDIAKSSSGSSTRAGYEGGGNDERDAGDSDVGSALARHASLSNAASLASIDRPPSLTEKLPPAKIYHPFSPEVLALLMPASVFGCLARLGLEALVTYDGQSIFPLAWVQAGGCLVMGFGLGIRDPFGRLYVRLLNVHTLALTYLISYGPLYTAWTTGLSGLSCERHSVINLNVGFCGSFTTFSSWQLQVFQAWINADHYHRDWLRDVSRAINYIYCPRADEIFHR